MDMIGHNSRAVSQNYTQIEEDSKRKALALLPDVTASDPKRKYTKTGAPHHHAR
jgi:hypothetical protein